MRLSGLLRWNVRTWLFGERVKQKEVVRWLGPATGSGRGADARAEGRKGSWVSVDRAECWRKASAVRDCNSCFDERVLDGFVF